MPIPQEVSNLIETVEQEYQAYGSRWWWRLYRYIFYPSKLRQVLEKQLNGDYQAAPAAYCLDMFKALAHGSWWLQRVLFSKLGYILEHYSLIKTVERLNEAGLLSGPQAQANFDAVAEHGLHQLVMVLGMVRLRYRGLLTTHHAQANFDAVMRSQSPDDVILSLEQLNAVGLLNGTHAQANREAVARHPFPQQLARLLESLFAYGLREENINQPQQWFDLIIEHTVVLFGGLAGTAWARIPLVYTLTAQQFTDMVAICQDTTQTIEVRQTRLAAYMDRHLVGIIPQEHRVRDNINDRQSTHTASVHEAVSESAIKLKNRYGECIQGNALDKAIMEVTDYVSKLRDDSIQNKAAKSCLSRLAGYGGEYGFKDRTSDVTTKQLLALSWRAIHDEANRLGELVDAKARLVQGLYEIQRGYNLSEQGVDDGADDRPICQSGTFNKLVESLVGLHPDAHIRFVTKTLAANKLPLVVKEEAKQFLASKVASINSSEHQAVAELIRDITDANGCIEPIWPHIQAQVADRMFDEFGSLYRHGKEGDAFKGLIESGGPWVVLEDEVLDGYKQQLACSVTPKSEDVQTDASSVTTATSSPTRFFKPASAAADGEDKPASASVPEDVRLAIQ